MQGVFYLVRHRNEIDIAIKSFRKVMEDWDYSKPLAWKPEIYSPSRSLSQNALMHIWFSEMANHFSPKIDVDEEGIKYLMKNMFLGTEDIKVGNTTIPNQVRSTSKLDKGEMMEFLNNIYAWAIDHGVKLSNPQNSEWMKNKNGP